MSKIERVEKLAEKLRHEPYKLLTNDCFMKSMKLKRQCQELGIPARIIACIGIVRAQVFRLWWMTIPVIHGWVEVDGQRIEVSRPHGVPGTWGIIPGNIRPLIKLRF